MTVTDIPAIHIGAEELPFVDLGDGSKLKVIMVDAAQELWIIENIFVGNRLARGLAVLDDGQRIDLSRITSPLVVFASHGDAVSTVQMALRWIPDVWGSAARIREAGRTIIYTTHDSATHLSIFVSAEVADDNHRRIGSIIRTIEALPPGLYEMAVQEGAAGSTPEVRFDHPARAVAPGQSAVFYRDGIVLGGAVIRSAMLGPPGPTPPLGLAPPGAAT
jgi:hypothetical protein